MEEWEYIEGHKDLYKDKNYSALPCLQLEGNKTLMTERIIHLALEIICLLTGERFPPVKSGDHVTIKVSPPPSLTPEKNKEEKILEVTKKIIDLLTGEVNHLINVKVEVTESEEEVYLRTDVQCKEEKVPADDSSNNKPPERCPRPPYSWDSTQEGHIIPHHHQDEDQAMLTVEAMDDEEEEEGCLVIDLPCDENEAPPNIRTGGSRSRFMPEKRPHPLYSQDSRREDYGIPQHDQDKNMEKVQVVAIKQEKEESLAFSLLTREEEMPAEIGTGVSKNRIIPVNGPHPLYSQDSKQEDHNIPQHDQDKNMEKVVTIKQEKEENLSLPMLTRKEEMPEEIGPGGSRSSIIPEKRPHPLYSWVFRQEDHNPQHDQNKNKEKVQFVVVKQEKEAHSALPMAPRKEEMPAEIGPGGSRSSIIPEKRPRPLYSWVFRQEDHNIPQHDQNNNKEKVQLVVVKQEKEENLPTSTRKVEMPAKIGPGGSRSSIIPEKRPCPLYSWVYRQENHNIRQHDQNKNKNKEKVQVVVVKQEKEENSEFPMAPRKEGMPMDIGRDGHYVRKTAERSFPHSSLDHPSKTSDVNPDFPENFVYTSDINLGLYIADISPDSGKSIGGNRAERIYRCAECDKTFCQNAALVRHQRNHTGEKPFQCQDCGKSFTRKSILVEHRRIHTGEKPFSCLECGKCFTQRSGLLIHRKTHRGPIRFPCSGCGTFFTPMVKTEMGHETFCTLCQKSNLPLPASPESIEYEVEEQVPPEPESEKKVSRELNLVSQPKTSAGEKRHTCNECNKSFTRRSILVEHQRIHTGEKPFSCSLCWKSFTQRSGLVIHRRIHTREKVYSCTECSCVFTQKAGEENSCPECRNSSTQDPFKVEPPHF